MKFTDISKKVIFSLEDILEYFDGVQIARRWLNNAIEQNLIKRIRRDMYAAVDPTTGEVYANKYLIGSSVSQTAYIGYHSALEYYGLANQVYNVVYVVDCKKFNSFEYDDEEYIFASSPIHSHIERVNYGATLKVTDKERTLIDCINKIDLCGGIDEVLYALDSARNVSEDKMIEVLKEYNKANLYQRAAYLLLPFKDTLRLTDKIFEVCISGLEDNCRYFLEDEGMPLIKHKDLKLFAPSYEDLLKRINGGA